MLIQHCDKCKEAIPFAAGALNRHPLFAEDIDRLVCDECVWPMIQEIKDLPSMAYLQVDKPEGKLRRKARVK